jgi:TRAP transporter TAXI family solute receptor
MFGRRKLLAAMPATALAPRLARAEQSKIVLGTSSEGGSFVLYGVALLEALKLVDPTFEVTTKATEGSRENIKLLESGDIDLGMVSGEIGHELLLPEARATNKLSVITAMAPAPCLLGVRSASRYHGIADLVGRPVVWNMRDSALVVQARLIMGGLGLDIDKDFEPIYTERYTDGAPMVLDGRAAAMWGTGVRWPGFVQIADSFGGARFIAPNPEEIERIRKKYDFLAELTVPAGSYRGQYDAIRTVGTWSLILARPGLEDSVGYRLAAALGRVERVHGLTKHIADTTAKNTLAAISGPEVLQPGVAKYYKEKGLIK